jgi:hypothetical protein
MSMRPRNAYRVVSISCPTSSSELTSVLIIGVHSQDVLGRSAAIRTRLALAHALEANEVVGLLKLSSPLLCLRLPNPDPVGAAMRPHPTPRELTPHTRTTHRSPMTQAALSAQARLSGPSRPAGRRAGVGPRSGTVGRGVHAPRTLGD